MSYMSYMSYMSSARHCLLSACFCFWAQISAAHETWIAPSVYRAQLGASILIDIRNGQHFNGSSLPWLDWWIERFVAVEGQVERPLTGRSGDIPASRITPLADGLMVIGLQSKPETHSWVEWRSFENFIYSKGLPDVIVEHESSGLPRTGFEEIYQRFLKTLIGIGSGSGNDRALGFELEFVALSNPYKSDFSGLMSVVLLKGGQPYPNAPVTIFQRNSAGTVVLSAAFTDERGVFRFSTEMGGRYLLDAVSMRLINDELGATWHSQWAGMTFAAEPRSQK
jgi:cobalt/nickel transport protein